MNDLLVARHERRQQELQFLGRIIAFAVNDPKSMDDKLFKGAGQARENGPVEPVSDEQLEKWW